MYSRLRLARGGILNDDMGLGKTIQVIAFLSAIYGKTGRRSMDGRRVERRARRRKMAEARMERGGRDVANAAIDEGEILEAEEVETSLVIVPSTVRNNWL